MSGNVSGLPTRFKRALFRQKELDRINFRSVEHYEKGSVEVLPDSCPLEMSDNAIHMKVQDGSKIRNLMAYALKKIKEPETSQMSWNGSGSAIPKTISCAEVMKRKVKGLHQITDIRYRRTEEFWEPKLDGLERLKVKKDVPSVTILLSKEPLDTAHPSYQAPGSFEVSWQRNADEEQKATVARGKNKGGATPGSMERKRRRRGGKDARANNSNTKNNANKQTDSVGGGKVNVKDSVSGGKVSATDSVSGGKDSATDSAKGGNVNSGGDVGGSEKRRNRNKKAKTPQVQGGSQRTGIVDG